MSYMCAYSSVQLGKNRVEKDVYLSLCAEGVSVADFLIGKKQKKQIKKP